MSPFNEIKEKASDLAEVTKHKVEAAVEHTKAKVHTAKAKHAENEAERVNKDSDSEDRYKPSAA